jgi:hypothetical protein
MEYNIFPLIIAYNCFVVIKGHGNKILDCFATNSVSLCFIEL